MNSVFRGFVSAAIIGMTVIGVVLVFCIFGCSQPQERGLCERVLALDSEAVVTAGDLIHQDGTHVRMVVCAARIRQVE
jgi:hypothetical protein